MKKIILLCIVTLLISVIAFGQNNGINYKAIIKDNSGDIVANTTITVRFTILKGVAQTNEYQETHTPATNVNGLIILNIGEGATGDTFSDINWGSDDHFLQIEIDVTGGTAYTDMGTTEFKTVPYALNAANVSGLEKITEGGNTGWKFIGQNPANYGDIGINAVDLSYNGTTSTTRGATGGNSFAAGAGSTASGFQSIAMGTHSIASGSKSISFGINVFSDGTSSTAIGSSTNATGDYSIAMGNHSDATGESSTAIGDYTEATGDYSTAIGRYTNAIGDYSTAMGNITYADGDYSTTMGNGTSAASFSEVAIGAYNTSYQFAPNGDTQWNSTDRLFIIGNGTPGNNNNALIVLKNGTITAPSLDIAEITDNKSLITKEYMDTNLMTPGLEEVTENGNTGWRLIGRDSNNYGDIGDDAVDFSFSNTSAQIYGATGTNSFASGRFTLASGAQSTAMGVATTASGVNSTAFGRGNNASGDKSTAFGFVTTASGDHSTSMGESTNATSFAETVIGKNNTDYTYASNGNTQWNPTDRLFTIGNSNFSGSKSDALIVLKNGTITAPSLDLAEITDNNSLITKEYLDTNIFSGDYNDLSNQPTITASTGLEQITENGKTGWRLKGQNSANYGDIGTDAIDLSINSFASSVRGASSNNSIAIGKNAEASGGPSIAIGVSTIASNYNTTAIGVSSAAFGEGSTAIGYVVVASGNNSTAFGDHVNAYSYKETAMGTNTEVYTPDTDGATQWNETDRLFVIGNGNGGTSSNALTILKNGKMGILETNPSGFLEVLADNTATEPNLKLVDDGNSGARINFTNTNTTNGNTWSLFGKTNDVDENSKFHLFHTNAGNVLTAKGNGQVAIGGTPDTSFHVFHGISEPDVGLKIQNTGSNNNWFKLFTNNFTGNLHLYSKLNNTTSIGNFNDSSGAYSATSDRRLKTNFKELYFNWNNFMKLNTLTYNYKVQKDTKKHIGLIAQEVKNIYPELVSYNKSDDVYHLNYSGFGVIAIKAIQEQQKEIQDLKDKLNAKESAYNSLNERLEKIEALLINKETEISLDVVNKE